MFIKGEMNNHHILIYNHDPYSSWNINERFNSYYKYAVIHLNTLTHKHTLIFLYEFPAISTPEYYDYP